MSSIASLVWLAAALLWPAVEPPAAVSVVDGIEAALARPELQGAQVSVLVVDVDGGQRLFARDADRLLAPASGLKLITTAAVLAQLGAEASFETTLMGDALPGADGTLAGDLRVIGGGDPCLRAPLLAHEGVDDPVEALVDLVESAGIRRIAGAVLLDDGLFDRTWVHPDWKPGDVAASWGAPVGALSLHGNCLSVAFEGRGATLLTPGHGYRLLNEVRAADKSDRFEVWVMPPDAQGVIRLRGDVGRAVGRQEVRAPVRDPGDHFARCLAAGLAARGLLAAPEARVESGAGSRPGVVLARLRTPISNAVLTALKESDNTISEHLFKRLGAAHSGTGSFESGAAAVEQYLAARVGADLTGVVLRDGSGLSARNRVSARLVVDVLLDMARDAGPARDVFLRALPVSGQDGSLKDRLREAPFLGAVRAKTGYIARCSSLSGFVRTLSGRTLAFSILINDFPTSTNNARMKAVQDEICRALVRHS